MAKDIKHQLCLTAIRNLIKERNFLELSLQLEREQISGSEFNKLVNENPEKYVVEKNQEPTDDLLLLINEILAEVGITVFVDDKIWDDEVGVIFGLENI